MIAKTGGNSGMNGALRFPNLDFAERESTMNFGACKQGLLNPTRWFAITYAIATAVNWHQELTTLLLLKAMLMSSLDSISRCSPDRTSLTSERMETLVSQLLSLAKCVARGDRTGAQSLAEPGHSLL